MADRTDSGRSGGASQRSGGGLHGVDATLREDRLVVHGTDGSHELRLPYLIHPGLVQTAELGQLIAERLVDELEEPLPGNAPLRLRLPASWGVLRFTLPYDPSGQPDPHRQVQWEVECNAPESAEQYAIDWQAGGGGARVIAIRRSLVRFSQALALGLGLRLVTLGVQEGEDPDGEDEAWLDVARASAHGEGLAREHYREPLPWGRAALAVVAIALLAWAGLRLIPWERGESADAGRGTPRGDSVAVATLEQPVDAIAPGDPQPDPAPADADLVTAAVEAASGPFREPVAERPAVEPSAHADAGSPGEAPASPPAAAPDAAPPAVAGRPGALLQAWRDLIEHLAAGEARLPDFLVIDAGGILARVDGREAPLSELVGRPSRVSRVDDGSAWLHFDQPLWPVDGGLLPEDPARRPESLQVKDLAGLLLALDAPPQKLILQRLRDRGDGVGTVDWSFEGAAPRAALGWRVRLMPLAGPLGRPAER